MAGSAFPAVYRAVYRSAILVGIDSTDLFQHQFLKLIHRDQIPIQVFASKPRCFEVASQFLVRFISTHDTPAPAVTAMRTDLQTYGVLLSGYVVQITQPPRWHRIQISTKWLMSMERSICRLT